ncbi:MAG: hypothetical protein ACXV8V_17135, partial [Ilumatobacteraceae bacterium]
MQGLLVLSMRMTESGDERQIIDLASSAVPSLGRARLQGVHLADSRWSAVAGSCADPDVRADVEAQFAVLSTAGGPLAIVGEAWALAYPLRSLEGDFGYLVIAADEEPPPND